jgi:hypothetical protein
MPHPGALSGEFDHLLTGSSPPAATITSDGPLVRTTNFEPTRGISATATRPIRPPHARVPRTDPEFAPVDEIFQRMAETPDDLNIARELLALAETNELAAEILDDAARHGWPGAAEAVREAREHERAERAAHSARENAEREAAAERARVEAESAAREARISEMQEAFVRALRQHDAERV